MTITRYKRTRFWAVYDASGSLICICVYKKGAEEVLRRLGTPAPATDWCWHCKATLPAVANAASPCPHCGGDLLLLQGKAMRNHRFEQAMWGSRYGLLRAGGLCTLYDKNTGEVICELADREAALAILRHLQAGETPIPVQEFAHLRELAWLLLKAKLRAWWRGHKPPYIWAWPRRRSKRFRGVRRRQPSRSGKRASSGRSPTPRLPAGSPALEAAAGSALLGPTGSL